MMTAPAPVLHQQAHEIQPFGHVIRLPKAPHVGNDNGADTEADSIGEIQEPGIRLTEGL